MTVPYFWSGWEVHPSNQWVENLWNGWLANPPNFIGVDVETYSKVDHTLLGVGIALDPQNAFYITPDNDEFWKVICVLQNPNLWKVYHNAPFDLRVLRPYDIDPDSVHDTALMARQAMEVSAVLEDISWQASYVTPGDRHTESIGTIFERYGVSKVLDIPTDVLAEKCCLDAISTLMMYSVYEQKINMVYYNHMRRLIGRLYRISRQGILLDQTVLRELDEYYSTKVDHWRKTFATYGTNPASPKQVGLLLADRGNYLPLNKSNTSLSTDSKTLAKLTDPLAMAVLEFRRANKMLGTYIKPFLGKERAYTNLRMEAATGRVNSSNAGKFEPDRNLQNIPKNAERKSGAGHSVRSAFIPDSGMFTKADKSQVEIRILAELSQDKRMMEIFHNDGDLHADTVQAFAKWNISRVFAKNFNFGGPMYGGSPQTIADTIGVTDVRMVREMIDAWGIRYPQAYAYLLELENEGMRCGYIETMGGRKIRIPLDRGKEHAKHCCRNYPIQGTAFEDIANFMLDDEIGQYIDITRLQIHDELIFDGDVMLSDMVLNDKKTAEEGHPVYSIKGRLAHLSGPYFPLEVEKVTRWG